MRKSGSVAVAAVLACAFALSPAAAQTVDELIARNLKARGGEEKLRALESMRMTGKVMLQGMELPMTIVAKRPNLFRQDMEIQDKKVVTGFDGTTAWVINPMMGSEAPQQIQGPQADLARDQADFDGPLLDYQKKGHTVELIKGEGPNGTEKLTDGTGVFHVRVTRKNGRVQHYYLDAESGIELKQSSEMEGPDGQKMNIEQELSDYREVDGLMVPHSVKSLMNGTPVVTMTVEKIEFNAPIDDSVFKMPGKAEK
jgi:outer membrane lipoprotein-sorting protein